MNSFSFYFRPELVHQQSIKALLERKYEVLAADESKGVILARKKKTLLKPEVDIQIQINAITGQQTNINVNSKAKSNWLTGSVQKKAEQKFFRSLFNCFDHLNI